ncbi:hypothetical protein [Cyanobium sp. NIES-981]|uniref:hypothetical protein n=1 Tax=Cyanobium sp. NIES-981 TaxID=1851505 RepID=UPI0018D44CC8|nr:hypothetical protein [Cyanobium sp. NIES-981]
MVLAIGLAGRGSAGEGPSSLAAPTPTPIPARLAPFGDGYPAAGDPCRRLGESAATSSYLDDSAVLVGCPSVEAAAALGGRVVATVDGTTLVSIPSSASFPRSDSTGGDALVPGTDYNATTSVACGFDGGEPSGSCPAGVKRRWGEDGTTLVEITKPDGRKRALFFRGTTPYGADSAQADGSAGWSFAVSRRDDQSVIRFGPETYVIVDAFVVGG